MSSADNTRAFARARAEGGVRNGYIPAAMGKAIAAKAFMMTQSVDLVRLCTVWLRIFRITSEFSRHLERSEKRSAGMKSYVV
jgi:hypothetical protein